MRWPWQRKSLHDRLALSWSGQTLAYVAAIARDDGQHQIARMGVERQGSDTMDTFVTRVRRLGLKGSEVHAMLHLDQYQLLQIATPAVAPEELRSAARYQIRDMVDVHLDDITLDIMQVGRGQQAGAGQLYVVAAKNALLKEVMDFGHDAGWSVSVIDIQETAQRNLQTMQAKTAELGAAPDAALVVNERHALLTVCAEGELFYSRRLDVPEGFLQMQWLGLSQAAGPIDSFSPVAEYVPDYGGGGSGQTPESADFEHAQRFLLEVQRSLDVWDRTWSTMPLSGLRVYAGLRSVDLAQWLSQEMGYSVVPLDFEAAFPALKDLSDADQMLCLPLLGMLMRTNDKTL